MIKDKKLLVLLSLPVLLIFLGLALYAIKLNTESRKEAAATGGSIAVYPTENIITLNSDSMFSLKAVFDNGSAGEKLDYMRAEINFPKEYLRLSTDKQIDISGSGFTKIIRMDSPSKANENGKLVIELAAETPGSGPPTDKALNIANIWFIGRELTSKPKLITVSDLEVVSNASVVIAPISTTNSSVKVARVVPPTSTLTPVPGAVSCTDSDVSPEYPDGLDYFQKGTTVQKQPDGMVKTFEDYCAYAVVNQEGQANPPYSGLLSEWFCWRNPADGGKYAINRLQTCPSGCSNGACVRPPVSPTVTPTPLPTGWYDSANQLCGGSDSSRNYVTYFSSTYCRETKAFNTRSFTGRVNCSNDGTLTCYKAKGAVSNFTVKSQLMSLNNYCQNTTSSMPAYSFNNKELCKWNGPTPTPICRPLPPCVSGVTDENGNVIYCDQPPDFYWCPPPSNTPTPTATPTRTPTPTVIPTPTLTPTPTITLTPTPTCMPKPDLCNSSATDSACILPSGGWWCPPPTLTPTITPTPTRPDDLMPGDANEDGKVDGQDYVIWLNNYGRSTQNRNRDGDFNYNGTVEGLDLNIWRSHYQGKNIIKWATETVKLETESFYIMANGKKYYGIPDPGTSIEVRSDPGSNLYTTLEATWTERGSEMRLNMYFNLDPIAKYWWASELRTYDGFKPQGEWVYYQGPHFTANQGSAYTSNAIELKSTSSERGVEGTIYFKKLKLLPFVAKPTLTPTPSLSPTPPCEVIPLNCLSWNNGVATNTCPSGEIRLCPLPTCRPRPACLDGNPPCLLPETPDMCPPATSPIPNPS